MLLKLLGQLRGQHFQVLQLLLRLVSQFADLLVDVAGEEVRALSRVLRLVLHIFEQLDDGGILAVLERRDFIHHVLEQVLHEELGILVRLQSLVDFNFDHFAYFVSDLDLLVFESVNFVPHSLVHPAELTPEGDFLRGASHFFLLDPAVDTSDLGLKIVLQLGNQLVLPLEFCPHNRVHLIVAVAQFIRLVL